LLRFARNDTPECQLIYVVACSLHTFIKSRFAIVFNYSSDPLLLGCLPWPEGAFHLSAFIGYRVSLNPPLAEKAFTLPGSVFILAGCGKTPIKRHSREGGILESHEKPGSCFRRNDDPTAQRAFSATC
jgi:hypothetical protein